MFEVPGLAQGSLAVVRVMVGGVLGGEVLSRLAGWEGF